MRKEYQPVTNTENTPLSINFGMATAPRENPPKLNNEDAVNVREIFDEDGKLMGIIAVLADAVTHSGQAYVVSVNAEGIQAANIIPQANLASTNAVEKLADAFSSLEVPTTQGVKQALSDVNTHLVAEFKQRDEQSQAHELGLSLWETEGPPVTTLVAILIPDREIRDKRNRLLKSNAFALSIGDSRVYTARQRGLREIFPQHDANDLGQLILTMGMYEEDFLARMEALGTHIKLLRLTPGTRLYLTSDGIDRGVIEEIEKNYSHLSPQEKADRAIDRQRELYGSLPDDASIIVIEIT